MQLLVAMEDQASQYEEELVYWQHKSREKRVESAKSPETLKTEAASDANGSEHGSSMSLGFSIYSDCVEDSSVCHGHTCCKCSALSSDSLDDSGDSDDSGGTCRSSSEGSEDGGDSDTSEVARTLDPS